MKNELLDIIRIANREFQEFIDQVAQNGTRVVESRGAVRRLDKVDLRLKQVSQSLVAYSRSSVGAPEAAYELLKYRDNLKALRGVMETLQFSLLAEKARLENVRANLQSACAWATSVREISLEP
jgi:hypothetical protein